MKAFLIALTLSIQIPSGQIPQAKVPPPASRHYRLTTDYRMLGPQGMQLNFHTVTGTFTTRGENVRWDDVTVGTQHQTFMEGFQYDRKASDVTAAGFFRGFPADANDQRNLVWDELMFHSFTQQLSRLKLNEPFPVPSGDVALAGSGTFTNRQIELTFIGIGQRNRESCYIVHYEALLNRFVLNAPGATIAGRSDYLGDIWVSVRTHEIEYGTLFEEVAGVVGNVPGASGPQPLHVLRTATLQLL